MARRRQGGPRASARRGAPAHPVVARPSRPGSQTPASTSPPRVRRHGPQPGRRGGPAPAVLRAQPVQPRPRAQPRELWVIGGRDDGSLALLFRLHHVMADGAAALGLLGALFDTAPDPTAAVGMPGGRPPGIPHRGLRCRRQRNCSSTTCTGTAPGSGARPGGWAGSAASAPRPSNAATVGLAKLLLAGAVPRRCPSTGRSRPSVG